MRWKSLFDIVHIFLYLITGIKTYETYKTVEIKDQSDFASGHKKEFLYSAIWLSVGIQILFSQNRLEVVLPYRCSLHGSRVPTLLHHILHRSLDFEVPT